MSDCGTAAEPSPPSGYRHKWHSFLARIATSCAPDCDSCPAWGGPDEFGLCLIAEICTDFEKDEDGDIGDHVQPEWCPRKRPESWGDCDGCGGCLTSRDIG